MSNLDALRFEPRTARQPRLRIGIWTLGFHWDLGFGLWDFPNDPFPLPPSQPPLQYPNLMPNDRTSVSPPVVAIAGWLLPGAGYWLLGQRGRALTVGITILSLFVLGLLIAGIRVLEIPGYDISGQRVMVGLYDDAQQRIGSRWIMTAEPLSEIRNKPWSVPQVLTGPISILAAVWSIHESIAPVNSPEPRAEQSHARINEIGSLYLSIAGLLNLMVIIDAAHRAGQRNRG
jgi:hypothetical protein